MKLIDINDINEIKDFIDYILKCMDKYSIYCTSRCYEHDGNLYFECNLTGIIEDLEEVEKNETK